MKLSLPLLETSHYSRIYPVAGCEHTGDAKWNTVLLLLWGILRWFPIKSDIFRMFNMFLWNNNGWHVFFLDVSNRWTCNIYACYTRRSVQTLITDSLPRHNGILLCPIQKPQHVCYHHDKSPVIPEPNQTVLPELTHLVKWQGMYLCHHLEVLFSRI